MHALNSLRLEKAYRHWGHDITDEDTPLDAGLVSQFDKKGGFIGRDALLKQKEKSLKKTPCAVCSGRFSTSLVYNEPIWCGEKIVGDLTSGMYGHTIGTCLGMGYVSWEEGVSKNL